MAKIGLNNFLFGILTEASDGTATYGAGTKPGKAVSCNVEITNNDASLYADDAKAESDTSFQSGTVTMGIDKDDLVTQATLLGHEITDGNMVRNANDVAPYVGLGRIVVMMVDGAYKYKVEFLNKVKFSEPSQEDTTKGEDIEFGTVEIEGTVSTLSNGDWSTAQTFDTRAAAVAYLNGLFGDTPTQYEVIYNANGGTGSIDTATVAVGESITLNNGSTLTAPSNKEFAGWAKTNDATSATYAGGASYTPTDSVTLYAVWVDAE